MNRIIEAIRRAPSVKDVSSLLDSHWNEKRESGTEAGIIFLIELRAALNQIDPIDVGESAEWANIQHARVYLHRITAKQSSQAK
ncbi:hypothetical protein LBMAG22_01620 [Bacteroidota bacterium]|nr:hypothetical protein LBMAG22_01620 [Bacteroidota bacterium]